jgi:hypothetical protein
MRFRWLGVVAALASLSSPQTALADDGGAAQALFDKGVADLEAGHPETACPALAESQRLDPRPGTLFALADCEVLLGKIASALGHYHEYIGWVSRLSDDQQMRHAERIELARAQVAALQAKVPTLVLALSPWARQGTIIERDGVALQGAGLGAALPIDPGEHVIVTRVPGEPEERLTVSIAVGDAKRLELPLRRPVPPVPVSPAPVPDDAARSASKPAPLEERGSSQRTLGYVAGGVGLAGLVVGTVTGLLVLDRKAIVDDECDSEHECSKEGKEAADSGKKLATASTIAFSIGLAATAAGVTLILTAPADDGRAGAFLSLTRRF